MNILILEDEREAASQLVQMVKRIDSSANIIATIETVRKTCDWLSVHPHPDLILADIQLADGISLDIFAKIKVNVPVIFITAYDEYTLKAFKLNSIDYLLKPVDEAELKAAFTKYHSLKNNVDISNEHLYKLLEQVNIRHLSRFIVKYRDELRIIAIEQVCYLRADDRLVFLHTITGEKYIVDNSLDELEKVLDPHLFFRLNRQYISPFHSIQKISNHFNGKLKLELKNCADNKIFISREKAHNFRKWISGN